MKIDLVLISSRLAEARRLQAVELAEAATQTGIDAGRLASLEAGQLAPSGDELLGGLKSEVQHRWLIFNEW